jgi:hypothetical protein
MRRALAALATAGVASFASCVSTARAQEPEPPVPDPTPESTVSPRRVTARLGIVGATQGLYDLRLDGAGLALSLGSEGHTYGTFVDLRFLDLRTLDGLVALEGSATWTLEGRFAGGWRAGGGAGISLLNVDRVTSQGSLLSLGPMLLGRVGYDFGEKPNVYLLLDVEGQWQASGAAVWGPSVQAGLRF